jgi:hypothetical protein
VRDRKADVGLDPVTVEGLDPAHQLVDRDPGRHQEALT